MSLYFLIISPKDGHHNRQFPCLFYYQSGKCPGAGCGLGRGGEVQPSRPTGSSIASLAASGTHPAVPVTLCQFLPAVLVAEGPCPICLQISNTP